MVRFAEGKQTRDLSPFSGLCLDPPEFISWFFKYPARRVGSGARWATDQMFLRNMECRNRGTEKQKNR